MRFKTLQFDVDLRIVYRNYWERSFDQFIVGMDVSRLIKQAFEGAYSIIHLSYVNSTTNLSKESYASQIHNIKIRAIVDQRKHFTLQCVKFLE